MKSIEIAFEINRPLQIDIWRLVVQTFCGEGVLISKNILVSLALPKKGSNQNNFFVKKYCNNTSFDQIFHARLFTMDLENLDTKI